MKEIEINMVVSVPDEVTEGLLSDLFVGWVNENKWMCGGIVKDITEENQNLEREIGTLNKPYGIIGYKQAEVGHPVFETKDRYVIYLKHETLPEVRVPFYKDTFRRCINFTDGK
jgi:hypothetical protein